MNISDDSDEALQADFLLRAGLVLGWHAGSHISPWLQQLSVRYPSKSSIRSKSGE